MEGNRDMLRFGEELSKTHLSSRSISNQAWKNLKRIT